MEKKIIRAQTAPAPIGPYNQAVKAGNTLYISGQIALDPTDGTLYTGDIKTETEKVMQHLQSILKEAGMDLKHVVKASIFLIDMQRFAEVNEVYGRYFDGIPAPARETLQVAALPKGAQVEISMIAAD